MKSSRIISKLELIWRVFLQDGDWRPDFRAVKLEHSATSFHGRSESVMKITPHLHVSRNGFWHQVALQTDRLEWPEAELIYVYVTLLKLRSSGPGNRNSKGEANIGSNEVLLFNNNNNNNNKVVTFCPRIKCCHKTRMKNVVSSPFCIHLSVKSLIKATHA